MTGSDERAIGRLEGKMDLMLAEQGRAADARRLTFQKLEELDRKVSTTDAKVETIDNRLISVEEPVAEFSRWRERGVGALMLISFVAASIGGLIATMWNKITAAIAGG